ncbi:AI-2E family transporter [Gilvimarinus sp. F26214L]|uniref:AI-2E family transporter n=1 Tax=Gilvimarinus sp. DZF01 TaxID=3461371 RepID=UPI004045D6FF
MLETRPEYTIQEKRVFVWVLAATSAGFVWVMSPFLAPILWASILAVLFMPVNKRLLRHMPRFPTAAALLTLLIAVVAVILPVLLVLSSVVNEAVNLYAQYESGELNVDKYLERIQSAFPVVQSRLDSLGVDLAELREQAGSAISTAVNFLAKRSLNIGQNTLAFLLSAALMLYLAFFLLRDGITILKWLRVAFPLDDRRETLLFKKFSEVTRATVKGNVVVGLVQGSLGGLIFWILGVQPALLWAAMMAVSSLIPAVGTGLIWVPVALYLFAVGSYVQSIVLVLFGVLVIGTVDNILRPILVGRDTKLPDYIVLFSTLGGLAVVGIHGFVVGPLIAALFFTLWHMFILEFNPHESRQVSDQIREQFDE